MLETQTLGRLIDILLNISVDQFFSKNQINDYMHLFRDVSLRERVPLFMYTHQNYIGIDPERSHVQLSNQEKKEMLRLISKSSTFLILAISNLSRSCTLVKASSKENPSIFALDNLNFVPEKEEIELL